jgi:hypothetical protein
MSARTMTRRHQRMGSSPAQARSSRQIAVAGIIAVVLFAMGIAVFLIPLASPARPSPAAAIVGKWVNGKGGVIVFHSDGTGSIPGFEGEALAVPSATFSYDFPDPTHLRLKVNGETFVVEIKQEGDQLTWVADQANNIQFVYTRAK